MAQADGSVFIDSKMDSSGIQSGINSVMKMASGAGAAITAALGAAAIAAVKVGTDFYAAMSEVQAISGASGTDLERLTAKAKEMGATTKFSASESAEALKYMGMAGWNAEQMIAGLPGVMNLAAASGESLGTVSDIVTDALTAMGLKASDAAHFADVLAVASSASNTNVGMMGQTFKYAAPLAGALGYNIEDLSVAIGLMANSGIKADQSGTALRSMLTRMAKPTKDSAAAMERLGLEIKNSDGSMRPLNDVIVDMRAGFENLTDAEKAQYAAMLAGQEAMSGLLAIVSASDEDFDNLTYAIQNANGAAEKMARTMADNLAGDMEELGGALETIQIQIFESFNAPLRKAAQSATESINQISESLKTPRMQEALQMIGNTVSDAIENIASFAADAIPKVIEGITWVIENFDKLSKTAEIAGAAFIGFKSGLAIFETVHTFANAAEKAAGTVKTFSDALGAAGTAAQLGEKGLSLFQMAAGVLSGKVPLATMAQYALNTSLSALPTAAAIGGIAALAVGVKVLGDALSDTTAETKALSRETDMLLKQSKALALDTYESSEAYFKNAIALDENAEKAAQLASEIIALSASAKSSSEDQALLYSKIQALNEIVPDLNLAYDTQKGILNQTAAEMEALVKAQEARLQKQSAEEQQTQIAREQCDITEKLKALEEQRAVTVATLGDAEARVDALQGSFHFIQFAQANNDVEEHTRKIQALDAQMESLTDREADLGQQSDLTASIIADSSTTLARSEETLAAIERKRADAVKAIADEYAPLKAMTDEVIVSTNEYIKTLDKKATEFTKSQRLIDAETKGLRDLAESTFELANKTQLTADEEAVLLSNMSILSDMMPEVNMHIDEQSGLLGYSTEQMLTFVNAQAAYLSQQDAEERMTEIRKEQAAASLELAAAAGELETVQASMSATQERINELSGAYGDRLIENQPLINQLKAELIDQAAQTVQLEGSISTLNDRITEQGEHYQDAASIYASSADIINEAAQNGVYVTKQALEEQKKIADEQAKATEKMLDDMQKSYDRYAQKTQNMLGTLDTKTKTTLDGAIKNLESNTKAVEKWASDMEALTARGVDDGVLQKLREMGPESASLVAEMVGASDEKLQKLKTAFQKSGEAATKAMEVEFGLAKDKMETSASALVTSAGTGVSNNKAVSNATTQMVRDAHGATVSQIAASNFPGVGKSIPDGMRQGVENGTGSLVTAVQSMISKALAAAKTSLDSHSPSKKFMALGDDSVEGYEIPFIRSAQSPDAVTRYMDTMLTAAQAQSQRALRYTGGTVSEPDIASTSSTEIDYDRLAEIMASAPKPDIYLNDERVGTLLEPHISARQADRYTSIERSGAFA